MAYSSNDEHFTRLTECVENSWRRQRNDRAVHQNIIHHLLGDVHPSVGPDGFATGIPLLSMAARSMARHLISKAPRVTASCQPKELKSWAENAEIATNKRIIRSNLAAELRECANQSMVSFGTMFLGPCYVGTPEEMKLDLEIRAIDRADYFYDIRSATLEDADFQGHEFDMTLTDVHDNPMFEECRMEIVADGRSRGLGEESSNLRRTETSSDDLYDYVRIRCVYEKRRNKLFYYARHQPEMKLAEIEWYGPRHGPYRYLYYEKPPGNAIPISPLMHLLKKHRAFNLLDVKTIDQAQVQKNILFYSNAQKEEAETVLRARNNQSVLQENGPVRMGSVGGADGGTVGMAEKQKRDFNYATGGIVETFVQQAPTLGQERLLRGSANDLLEDMGGSAKLFIKGVCEDIFWFDIRDPNPHPQFLQKEFEGVQYEVEWTREHRQFAMELEYEIDVAPYSYVDQSPNEELADGLGALQLLMNFQGQMVAQGITLDFEAVLRDIAKAKNNHMLPDWFILNQDPEKLAKLMGPRLDSQPVDTAKPNGNYRRTSESDGAGAEMEAIRAIGKGRQNELQTV
jgi:hypothetical protein